MPGAWHDRFDDPPEQTPKVTESEKTKQQKENERKARQLKEKKARQRAEPVSYTHLTLPTKRIV